MGTIMHKQEKCPSCSCLVRIQRTAESQRYASACRANKAMMIMLVAGSILAALSHNLFSQEKQTANYEERKKIAASPEVRYRPSVLGKSAKGPGDLAEALGLDPASVPISYSGVDAQVDVFPAMGVLIPRQGSTFVLMSTGIAGGGNRHGHRGRFVL
jgi:hypothetical protein